MLRGVSPNYSFKPSPLRGLGAAFVGTQRAGLTQVLALQSHNIGKEPSKSFPAPLLPRLRP